MLCFILYRLYDHKSCFMFYFVKVYLFLQVVLSFNLFTYCLYTNKGIKNVKPFDYYVLSVLHTRKYKIFLIFVVRIYKH